jgi:hypothetical protein
VGRKNKFPGMPVSIPVHSRVYLDTGAQQSIIGLRQEMAYCEYKCVKFKPKPKGNKY